MSRKKIVEIKKGTYTIKNYDLSKKNRWKGWTLYSQRIIPDYKIETLYHYSRKKDIKLREGYKIPGGYVVHINKKTGLPYLKKEK